MLPFPRLDTSGILMFRSDTAALYIPERPLEGQFAELPEEEARHVRALRLREGEPVLLLDGHGARIHAIIERLDRRGVLVRAVTTVLDGQEGGPYIVLCIGLLADKSRFEWIIEKAVELGAREIVPMATARSEGRFNADRAGRIAVAALKQSQRSFLPVIPEPVPLAALLAGLPASGRAFICHESASIEDSMERFLLSSPVPERITVLIGPEGGFTQEEVEAARRAGAQVVSLGGTRLRAETAALAALVLTTTLPGMHCRQEALHDGTQSDSSTGD